MDKKIKYAFYLLVLFGAVSIGCLLWFSSEIAVLGPKGIIGDQQSSLLTISTLLMMIVVVPTLLLTFVIAWRYRESNKKAKYTPEWSHSTLAEAIWWGVPFVIIIILGVITWVSCHQLDPFRPLTSDKEPVRVQVVALQWKWLFIYPDQGIATVNFLEIPEKTPINFEITADAPMNSFWIPRLGGQVYAMAGMKSKLHLMANGVDSYRGASANFSGEGFAGMQFEVRSVTKEDFDSWVNSVRSSSMMLDYSPMIAPTSYVPAATYRLGDQDLFNKIVMKYMGNMHHGN